MSAFNDPFDPNIKLASGRNCGHHATYCWRRHYERQVFAVQDRPSV